MSINAPKWSWKVPSKKWLWWKRAQWGIVWTYLSLYLDTNCIAPADRNYMCTAPTSIQTVQMTAHLSIDHKNWHQRLGFDLKEVLSESICPSTMRPTIWKETFKCQIANRDVWTRVSSSSAGALSYIYTRKLKCRVCHEKGDIRDLQWNEYLSGGPSDKVPCLWKQSSKRPCLSRKNHDISWTRLWFGFYSVWFVITEARRRQITSQVGQTLPNVNFEEAHP